MPELPEAETIVRDLHRRVRRAVVRGVSVPHPDILADGLSAARLGRALRGRRITGVSRRGKNIVIEFDHGFRTVINLGMTGRVMTDDVPAAAGLRHVALRFRLEDGRTLLFDDVRRFGRVDLFDADAWTTRSDELGVEPLAEDFTAERLHQLTRQSITPIRSWLLDQRHVAGIGNIYANEALFRARIRPTRRTRSLSRRETGALRDAIVRVLREAVRARGTTLNDFRDTSGRKGRFQLRLRVYDREARPCRRCRTPIRRIVLTNRSAFYCPACQS